MTPYQLDESANAPCTRTMVGLAGCAVATGPRQQKADECPDCHEDLHLKLPILAFSPGSSDAGRPAIKAPRIHVLYKLRRAHRERVHQVESAPSPTS